MEILFVNRRVLMSSSSTNASADKRTPFSTNQRLMLNLGLKGSVGLVSAGILSLLVARRSCTRWLVAGLGGGAGLGYGWCQNDMFLKDPKLVDLPTGFEAEFNKIWTKTSGFVPAFAKFK